jgi:hypothetical protein
VGVFCVDLAEILFGIVVPLLLTLGFGFLTLSNPTSAEFLAARICALLALLDVAAFGGYWLYTSSQLSIGWRLIIGGVLGAAIFALGLGSQLWVDTRQYPRTPSLVFVFGVPLGDNRSAKWLMMLKHFGPEPAYNCYIDFYDDDRKNIEYLWRNGPQPRAFSPPGWYGNSQTTEFVAEAGLETPTRRGFQWEPINPDSQHYTVSINCRAGSFVEKLEVTRVSGVLRAKIVIEHGPGWTAKHPNESPLVFKCEDPEFVTTALATTIPTPRLGVITTPGWKPNYRFEPPVAIIDTNNNIQIVSAIKQADGSDRTDFGCWNLLTKHLGE